jgi:seryl-tRNA synthetase
MHDIKQIRQNPDHFRHGLQRRGETDSLDRLLTLDRERRDLVTSLDERRARRNAVSKEIGQAKKSGGESASLESEMRELGSNIQKDEARERELESEIEGMLLYIPNLPADTTPDGRDATENVVVRSWGEAPVMEFTPLDHLDLADKLELLDFRRGGKITGSGFPVWSGYGARLERALINFFLDMQTSEHGYREMMTPFVANRDSMQGSGQIPKLEDDMYHCTRDDIFLIPTSEVPLVNMHRGDTLTEDQLPIKYCAYSPCFRREAGTYGKDTRGFLRVHQFNKVELVRFEKPENSYQALEEIVSHAEKVLQLLELKYRVVRLCAGDMGFNAAACYDLEVWAPATGKWLEVSSCSNCTDFQARRANIRFRRKETGKLELVHTLNGSGLATSRVFVALLETYQTDEGAWAVPAILRPYLDGKTVITAPRERLS